MTVKQLSVFMPNEPGKMAELAELFRKNGIDMRALSTAETKDFGILRVIVDDVEKTSMILREEGYAYKVSPVIAVEVVNEPGGLCRILDILGEAGINLEYMYAFLGKKINSAYMIFRVADTEKAIEKLVEKGVTPICQKELANL